MEITENVDGIFQQLLRQKYTKATYKYFKTYFRSLELQNYYFVDDFVNAIKTTFDRISVFKSMSSEEYKESYEESFYEGMPNDIKAKFAIDGVDNVDTIVLRIRNAETHILNNNQSTLRDSEHHKSASQINHIIVIPLHITPAIQIKLSDSNLVSVIYTLGGIIPMTIAANNNEKMQLNL